MPKKTVVPNFNAIDKKFLTYGIKTISKVFKDFSNSAEPLLGKLPDLSNKYIPKPYFFITRILLSLTCFILRDCTYMTSREREKGGGSTKFEMF